PPTLTYSTLTGSSSLHADPLSIWAVIPPATGSVQQQQTSSAQQHQATPNHQTSRSTQHRMSRRSPAKAPGPTTVPTFTATKNTIIVGIWPFV
ncbi:hypothetical protein APHAL10511_008717, partial [Amanita phalloides]